MMQIPALEKRLLPVCYGMGQYTQDPHIAWAVSKVSRQTSPAKWSITLHAMS